MIRLVRRFAIPCVGQTLGKLYNPNHSVIAYADCGRAIGLIHQNNYSMSMLTDYFSKKSQKKQEGQFKKEMEYLANKPVFTLMDYKQRVEDELSKAKSQIRAKLSAESQQNERQLEMEKKVMNSMFEEELNMERQIKFDQKKEVALVTQLPLQFVTKTISKFLEYKNMHKLLRQLKLNNEPLPQNIKEFQQLYLMSGVSRQNKKFKYHKYKEVNELHRIRHLKKTHDHGYFF